MIETTAYGWIREGSVKKVKHIVWAGALLALGAAGTAAGPVGQSVVQARSAAHLPCPGGILSARPLDLGFAGFGGIAAVSRNDVWAVGSIRTADHATVVPLIEHYDGRIWCTVDPHSPDEREFGAVTSVSPRDVWAVGSRIEHWDGHAWVVVPSPSLGSVAAGSLPWELSAISASAANNVWAMSSERGFVERWDGHRWQKVLLPANVTAALPPATPVAHPELEQPALEALVTVSVTDTWVVGRSGPDHNDPWAMHWDGHRWQQMTLPRSPAPASYSPDLRAVCEATDPQFVELPAIAALSHDDVWVVGSQNPGGRAGICPLAFHWDGKHWREVWLVTSPPDVSRLEDTFSSNSDETGAWELTAMTATPSGHIWAVGDPEQFSLQWDGHTWQLVYDFTGPTMTEGFQVTSLSAASDSDIWASGVGGTPWNAFHWDGTTWRGVAAIPAG